MPKSSIYIGSTVLIVIIVFVFAFKVDGSINNKFCSKKIYDLYCRTFLSQDGRIIDYDRNGITTSEGQSYIMLESIVIGNKEVFNISYKWAKDNLQRNDGLFAWLWGKNLNGEYKVLDENSASDADCDIAFALLLAYEKWGDYKYLSDAQKIINSVWDNEVRQVGSHLALMPGVKQASESKIELNPSYFSPYAFKLFQKYDELHNWDLLVESSYYYITLSMNATKTGLPPNWFLLENGKIILENSEKSDFSYDAIRVFSRIYLDYVRTGDTRDIEVLRTAKYFIPRWEKTKHFYTNYKSNAELRDKVEFEGAIAVLVPVIAIFDKQVANDIYIKKIEPYLDNENYWSSRNNYYAKNLLWFGIYVYNSESEEYKNMKKINKKLRS